MPQLRNITVHVTDGNGNDLEEWGVQNLRGNKVSAYIKSTTNMPFRVSIRPKIPYMDVQQLLPGSHHSQRIKGMDGGYIKMEESDEDVMNKIPSHPQARPQDRHEHASSSRRRRSTNGDGDQPPSRRQRYSNEHPASSPIYWRNTSHQDLAPPFSLLATLYLDGRKKPERRTVVYLSLDDEDFNYPDGKVVFRCRCVQGRDGRVKEQAWVFKDIGIETVFKRIALSDDSKDVEDPEDFLVNAMNMSKFGDEQIKATHERDKVGQIVVELKRITLGRKYDEPDYRVRHYEGDKDDVDMEGVNQDVVHKTALEDLRTVERQATRCIEFEDYVKGEGPWATFQFFYRSQESLEKFDFPGFPSIPRSLKKLPRDGRALNTNLAILTPLSIAHPLKPSPVSAKKSKRTFEERVREGLGDFEKSEYEFLGYRDPLGDASATTYGESSNPTRTSAIANAGDDAEQKSNDRLHARGTLSTVVAVKERAHRRSRALFTAGASRSRSSGPSPEDSPLSRSAGLSVEPPANSPTTGFYDPVANPRLSAPKGSALDTFKTLSDASLALAKESESRVEGQLAPKYAIKDTRYRQADHGSDADDEQGEWQDSGSSTSNDEDTEISDKENVPPADADDSGLHKELGTMTLGTKRLRGDGSGELEEGEIEETEKRQIKKQALPGNRASVEDVAQMKEEEEQAARHPSNMADEGK